MRSDPCFLGGLMYDTAITRNLSPCRLELEERKRVANLERYFMRSYTIKLPSKLEYLEREELIEYNTVSL